MQTKSTTPPRREILLYSALLGIFWGLAAPFILVVSFILLFLYWDRRKVWMVFGICLPATIIEGVIVWRIYDSLIGNSDRALEGVALYVLLAAITFAVASAFIPGNPFKGLFPGFKGASRFQ